jgi:3'-phosphoadenosine 5'-phosphosulfate (PAPS) 3'-phosphatase
MKDFVELFEAPQFNSYGSSLKLLMVAEGSAHVYPRCEARRAGPGGGGGGGGACRENAAGRGVEWGGVLQTAWQ